MTSLSPAELASALALVGVVILIAALLSGLVERSGVPQVALLAVGARVVPVDVRKDDARILGPPADAWLVLYCT